MYELKTLKNGVRIAYEHMPFVRSAAIGVFVGVGSRYEKAGEGGSAHFIEHMLFKSTFSHSAKELAYIMDSIGGQVNAFTTRETTCFYAKVLDTHLDEATNLLTEMFFDCAFDDTELESERGVIFEEMNMYEDTPEDLCYEDLMKKSFPGSLGRPVLGTTSSLGKMNGASLRDFRDRNYTAGNIVVSLCGSFTDENLALIEEKFGSMPKTKRLKCRGSEYAKSVVVKKKKTEQNQFCLAFPAENFASEDRFAMNLLSTAFGGGSSSRLFQNIREKYGLCYSIYSFQSRFSDCGVFAVATAVNRDTEMKTLELIRDEINKLLDDGISPDELDRARQQALSSLYMGLESTSARMQKLGNSFLRLESCLTTDEVAARYEAVTCGEIERLAREKLDFSKMSLSAVGKVSGAEEYASVMGI